MKKIYLSLFFAILFILPCSLNLIAKDKKRTSDVPYMNSTMGEYKFHRITDYLIFNAVPFSFDYSQLVNKSAQEEDSIPVSKIEYEYENNNIFTTSYDWKNETWVPDLRDEYYFSFSTTLSDSSIFYNYDTINLDWDLDAKWISSFNELGQRTEQIMYEYQEETSTWKKSIKQKLDYLNNGDSIVEEQFYWPEIDTNWTQTIKFATTYENGRRKKFYLFNWDFINKSYTVQSMEEFFYDEAGNLIKSVSSSWDVTNEIFVEIMKLIYSGDDLEYITYFILDNGTQIWKPNGLLIFNLDENGRSTSRDQLNYNEGDDNFLRTNVTEFIYEDQVVGVNNLPKLEVQIYPNPVKDLLIVKLDNPGKSAFEIIDINGRVLLSKQSNNALNRISMQELNSGIYFLKVNSRGQMTTKQIIKE